MLIAIMLFYWCLLVLYSALTVYGVWEYSKPKPKPNIKETHWPSVDILIPCHNEGLVIEDTLKAMVRQDYPGNLNIYVLNDNSKDNTGEIVQDFDNMVINLHNISVPAPKPDEPKGKSRVLNYGISISSGELLCIYDADNQPEQDAVTQLVIAFLGTTNSCGAVGVVRTINENTNLLTRMIALEFRIFQLLMQSGRWRAFKTGSFAGTNMLVRRDVLASVGNYDPYALAEDAELTVRLTAMGYATPVTHHSVTWEQEPDNLKVYLKQRTRWLVGNIYLLEKMFTPTYFRGRVIAHTIHHIIVYVCFILLLLINVIIVALYFMGVISITTLGPVLFAWYMAYIVYTVQILSSLHMTKSISLSKMLVGFIMYFTYAQLFLVLFVRAMNQYVKSKIAKKTIQWDKTERVKL